MKSVIPVWIPAVLFLPSLAWADATGTPMNVAPMLPATDIPVVLLERAPVIDGDLGEWSSVPAHTIPVTPTLEKDEQNRVGTGDVVLRVGVHGDRFHMALRWPDETPDEKFRPWRWRNDKYQRTEVRDDQFVVRFHMSGDYDSCMLSKTNYQVDVWRWSAGRSNPAGLAEDQMHIISLDPMEEAAEFLGPYGTTYLLKRNDDGEPFYKNAKAPAVKKGDEEPGIVQSGPGSGSLVDVTAKGVWKEGYWNLEFSRLLNTGHGDDAVLVRGGRISGAIGVFNRAGNEHKSVSGTLNFLIP
ncbi:MAG: hypothetical protein G8237_06285 [Magnetococcales bacterium]|nr:hypothetical protein [Magnetococcales bacterium]